MSRVGSAKVNPLTWVDEHGDVLYRYALLRVRERETAEDLVQETFLAAWNAKQRFAQQSSEQTWLISILRRKIADHFRTTSHGRTVQATETDESSHGAMFDGRGHWMKTLRRWPDDPAKALENKEFWKVFDDCLSKLTPALARAFLLRELENVTTQEACATLDITATNLSVRLHRARLSLRECMEQNWFASRD